MARVTAVERRVEWLSGGRNDILVKTEPVDIGAAGCVFLAQELESCAVAVDIGIAGIIDGVGLEEGLENLGSQGCALGEDGIDDRG